MSTPEKAFLTDWSYIAGNIAISSNYSITYFISMSLSLKS